MAQPKRRYKKKGKRKGKVILTQRARLVEKNDATSVARTDTTRYPRMQAQMPRSTGVVFKVKIKKK